jgi:hypothetical protein
MAAIRRCLLFAVMLDHGAALLDQAREEFSARRDVRPARGGNVQRCGDFAGLGDQEPRARGRHRLSEHRTSW